MYGRVEDEACVSRVVACDVEVNAVVDSIIIGWINNKVLQMWL